jgi:parallel beta-helix repeat protein
MRRKIVAVWVSLVLILGFVVMIDIPINYIPTAKGAILYVNETGSNGAYPSIQIAVDLASDGDTVFIYKGTYNERVTIGKMINLTGEDKNNTVLNGTGSGDVLIINSNYVNITGLNVKNSGGTYWWDAGIEITDAQNCNISDNIVNSNSGIGIKLDQCSGITLISNDVYSNTNQGINLRYSSNNTIINNNVSYNDYEGILIRLSANNIVINNTLLDNDIKIEESSNNDIINNTMPGIHILESDFSIISNNEMNRGGIVITGDLLNHWNTHDIDNSNTLNEKLVLYWKNTTGGIIPMISGQVILANCSNIQIENMEFSNVSRGIQLGFSSNITITNNSFLNNGWYGIYLQNSSSNQIMYNYLWNNNRGLYLYSSHRNNISYNYATENFGGLHFEYSRYNNISENNCPNNGVGIELVGSHENHVEENTANMSSYSGFIFHGSTKNNIIDNNGSLNNGAGIYLGWGSYRNNVTDNKLFSNNLTGLFLERNCWLNNIIGNEISGNDYGIEVSEGSDGNTLISNLVQDNRIGILFFWSDYNTIYHNRFINNTFQASDPGANDNNKWDNGYPVGGNYWSNYTGVDNFKGPNQDQPGSDGIGDTNYSIDGDSIDHYPLMEPYYGKPLGNHTILKEGWNLISIPFIQEDQNLEKVLEMIAGYYDAVQWFNLSDPKKPWKHNKISKPFGNDLFELNETMSFWIHITNPGDTIFVYNGTAPTSNQTIQLHPGWNMVGYPSLTQHNRTDGLNNLSFDTHVDCIQWYDAVSKTWHFMDQDDNFVPGRGYWVHSNVEVEWEVPL